MGKVIAYGETFAVKEYRGDVERPDGPPPPQIPKQGGNMAKYRKKPVVIEAVQLKWTTWNEMCDFLGDIISPDNPGRESEDYSDTCSEDGPYIELTIPTLEGDHVAKHGDFIIKGIKGEFYPCKPDIFKEIYEEVNV